MWTYNVRSKVRHVLEGQSDVYCLASGMMLINVNPYLHTNINSFVKDVSAAFKVTNSEIVASFRTYDLSFAVQLKLCVLNILLILWKSCGKVKLSIPFSSMI